MKIAATAVWIGLLALLPGCSLLWGGNHPDVEPEYFAVSSGAAPVWRGTEVESIPHLRLRIWLLDSGIGGRLSNTFDPETKILGTHGLLIRRENGAVEAIVFEDARFITPAGGGFYCITYGERGQDASLWSEAGGFEPIELPPVSKPWMLGGGVGGAVAVIPGRVVAIHSTGGRLVAMDWAGELLADVPWPEGFEVETAFPVLDDTAILLAYPEQEGEPSMDEGVALWRPSEGLHVVGEDKDGHVQGPGNAYFGFGYERDRIVRLSWPEGEQPRANRVYNVGGYGRTASAMSPDGRYVVSGDPGFKVIRDDPRFHQVHDNGVTIARRVGELSAYGALDPVWLHPKFGAPTSVQIVPRP